MAGIRKLTLDQVRNIKRRYALGGISQMELALDYDVSQRAIWGILNRQAYQELEDPEKVFDLEE